MVWNNNFFFFCIFTSGRFCLTRRSAEVRLHFREAPGWSGRVHMYGKCQWGWVEGGNPHPCIGYINYSCNCNDLIVVKIFFFLSFSENVMNFLTTLAENIKDRWVFFCCCFLSWIFTAMWSQHQMHVKWCKLAKAHDKASVTQTMRPRCNRLTTDFIATDWRSLRPLQPLLCPYLELGYDLR